MVKVLVIEQYDTVHYRGIDYQVQAVSGEKVVLRSLRDGRTLKTTLGDLLANVTSSSRDSLFFNERILDTLLDEDARAARFWYGHVMEVESGVNPNLPDSARANPQYSMDQTLSQRIQTKLLELKGIGIEISAPTLRRKIYAYRAQGITGLIDARKQRRRSTTGRIPGEIVAIAEELIGSQTMASTRGKSYMMDVIADEAASRGITAPLPSRATIYRLLDQLGQKRHTFDSAMTRRTTANSKPTGHRVRLARFPGENMEIDSTPLDVMAILPDGEIARVELTALIDIATRSLCAWVIKPRGTKAVDAVELLARTMTPMPLLPGADIRMAMAQSILANAILFPESEKDNSLSAKPVIKPQSLTVDRGKVFISETFLRACARLNVQVIKASPYTPTDKPHIERSFASINSLFTQYLPGYVGKNPAYKGKDPTAEAILTLDQIRALFDYWVISIYQNRPHGGLSIPLMPRKLLSPNQMYAALAVTYPQVAVAFTKDDYVGLLPMKPRTIKRDGITLNGLRYDSPVLNPFREVKSGQRSLQGKWEVRHDPYDLTRIWLRVPNQDSFLEVEWVYAEYINMSFSIDTLQAAKSMLDQKEPAQSDLLAAIKKIQVDALAADNSVKSAKRTKTKRVSLNESKEASKARPTNPEDVGSSATQSGDSVGESGLQPVEPYPVVRSENSWW